MIGYTNEQKAKMEEDELEKALDNLDRDSFPTANIIVAGITGAGKSTLLNAVFGEKLAATGKGRPVTDHIEEYHNDEIPIHIWDTVGLELDAEKTKKSINSIRQTIADKAGSADQFDRIHAIWYCINSGSNKYQTAESEFIKSLYSVGVPFIIVLTQCIGEEDEMNDFEAKIKDINISMGLSDIDVIQVCAKDVKLRGLVVPAFGLDALVDTTIKKIPYFIKSAFAAAQKVSKSQKREQCEEIIYAYVKAAKEGFWDKVPLMNIIYANNRILTMFRKIGSMYNTYISQDAIIKITRDCSINFDNTFQGLINPFYGKYYRKVMTLLQNKRAEGFEVNLDNVSKSDRVAILIAFYGYTFIAAIEELWGKFTEDQLKDIDVVCDNLIGIINRILREKGRR